MRWRKIKPYISQELCYSTTDLAASSTEGKQTFPDTLYPRGAIWSAQCVPAAQPQPVDPMLLLAWPKNQAMPGIRSGTRGITISISMFFSVVKTLKRTLKAQGSPHLEL